GARISALTCAWNPGAADLLVVGVRDKVTDTLGLCRFLAFCSSYSDDSRHQAAETLESLGGLQKQARRADAPLLVLVPAGQETLFGAALEAGAYRCLMLPIHAKQVTS